MFSSLTFSAEKGKLKGGGPGRAGLGKGFVHQIPERLVLQRCPNIENTLTCSGKHRLGVGWGRSQDLDGEEAGTWCC